MKVLPRNYFTSSSDFFRTNRLSTHNPPQNFGPAVSEPGPDIKFMGHTQHFEPFHKKNRLPVRYQFIQVTGYNKRGRHFSRDEANR